MGEKQTNYVSYMKILFLGYDEKETALINLTGEKPSVANVDHASEMVSDFSGYDLVISYGYQHIITAESLSSLKRPALNLHISYLPYNRGSDPNHWSFVDNTPSGVTIHEIDSGVDTGPIICQKYVNFDRGEKTFSETYNRLRAEIEQLFAANIEQILSGDYNGESQRGFGSYHKKADLPDHMGDWNVNIAEYLENYDREKYGIKAKLAIVDEIEKIRTNNNVNWMDLLRLTIKASPSDAKKLINRINSDDNKISDLFARLGK